MTDGVLAAAAITAEHGRASRRARLAIAATTSGGAARSSTRSTSASFADGNGDGIGDLAGVRARLHYLADLGVDAIWFTPWYVSPLADGGYDVADYRAIDPAFGSLAEAEQLIAEARALGIRTIVDIVPNHVSDQHAVVPGRTRRRARLAGTSQVLVPARSRRGRRARCPNGWLSNFSGPTWTRTTNPDGTPGEWYLHLFSARAAGPQLGPPRRPRRARGRPQVLVRPRRGRRPDRLGGAARQGPGAARGPGRARPRRAPNTDRDELHDIYRGWRAVADSYSGRPHPGRRDLAADIERFAKYLRPDELHTAFNFDFLARPWDAASLRDVDRHDARGPRAGRRAATWVLSNHDVTRPVTRYGQEDTSFAFATKRAGTPTDLELGRRRARAAAMLCAALPGSLYIYQGEELGLDEVQDLPADQRQDPMYLRSGGTDPGRDGCRVPLPWAGTSPPFGFSPAGATGEPWLPQPTLGRPHRRGRAARSRLDA